MVAVTLYLAAMAVGLIFAYFKYIYRYRRPNEPPIVPGNLIFGNGCEFSKHAVNFLHKSQKKHGDIFTIRLLNQYLTMVMDPHSYDNFARERNFDFDAIQRQVNNNVFAFHLVDARKMLGEAGKTVKGKYINRGMTFFSKHLNDTFTSISNLDRQCSHNNTKSDEWSTDCLRSLASKTLFTSQFYTIFGKDLSDTEFTPAVVYKQFDAFHKFFNYLWLGLPIKLFPKALKALEVLLKMPDSGVLLARDDLSDYIRFAIEFMLANEQTEFHIKGHNLVYLHVNYNTFRKAFWVLYYLMENKEALDALREEVDDLIEMKRAENDDDTETVKLTLDDFDRLPILDSVIKETLRLASGVFIVRMIKQDTDFKMFDGTTHTVRAGDRVAMYPPAIHKDPEIFEDPNVFKYDRFIDATFYRNGKALKNPILTFGAVCPGKKYAMIQAKWFVLSMVHKFDFELLEGEKTELDAHYHGHEILPPVNDVHIRYRPRNSTKLEFV